MFNSYKNIYAICLSSIVLFILLKMDMLFHFTENEIKAFDAGLVAAFATALGTLPVLFSKKISQRAYDISLGFGSGVMLSACIFSLILPSLEAAKSLVSMPMLATTLVGFCIIFGAAFLLSIDIACPHHVFIQHFDIFRGNFIVSKGLTPRHSEEFGYLFLRFFYIIYLKV